VEETRCNLCGADNTDLVYEESDLLMKVPGTFRLVRCRECGLLYLNPRPTYEEMAPYYPEDYMAYTAKRENEHSWSVRLNYTYGYWKRARMLNAVRPSGGRILDVGCATGAVLEAMRNIGPWDVFGVEPSPVASQHARERLGPSVVTGELADAHYPDDFFDMVTIWDVLEHVHDPTSTLSEIRRILKPDGQAVIRVPNGASWDARLFGRHWVGFDAPRHLYIYSPKTLTALAQKAGLQIHRIRSLMLGYAPFALSVQFWLEDRMKDGPSRRALLALNRSLLPRLVTRPFFTALSYLNAPIFAMTAFAGRSELRE